MEELLYGAAPHSPEAEQAVLGAMLIDGRCIPDIITVLAVDDFFDEMHRALYEILYTMFSLGKTVDMVTVMGEMRTRGLADGEAQAKQLVARLVESTPTAAHALEYAEIVRDRALLRKLSDAATGILEQVRGGEGEADVLLDSAEQAVYDIRQGRSDGGLHALGVVLHSVYSHLHELARNPGQLPGLTTGLGELDQVLGGLGNSNLILIASRPGMGKTSIALSIALAAARESGKAVAFFSLEMSLEQIAARLLSIQSDVDGKEMLTGHLSEESFFRIAQGCEALSALDIRMDDHANITVPEMKAKCRRVENLGLIVIDYLQLMQSAKRSDNRVQEVAEISRSLKIMAKELNVPILCLSQLSRANEQRANRRPQLSDLRESGSIEQDADAVLFLYRDEYYNPDTEDKNIAECIIAKNRYGETGTVKLHWAGQCTKFSSLDWRHGP